MSEITRDTLMAYLDGQLDETTRAEVEAHLAANPDAALELSQLHRQSDAIRTLYGPAAAEPVPSRLDPHRLALARSRRTWQVASRAAMIVGVTIAFVQALTQVQEMTLTFVPKILAIFVTIAISAPFIGAQISIFTNIVFSRIESGF